RDEVIDFTQDYYPPTASRYVAMAEDVDLTGGVIAAQTNTIQSGYVAETGATLLEFATPDETIAAVMNGEADAVFADADFLLPKAEESGGTLMVVGDPVPLGGGVGMGLRETDTELKGKFDAAITSMKEDGSLNDLLIKWFGEGIGTY
ncbi:MAG: transporter substrate-binding domain-containing protein, partial [Silicimonas sp.]|nr:transporter substrate-binding domain-containing protein [Silicimonas sp.]